MARVKTSTGKGRGKRHGGGRGTPPAVAVAEKGAAVSTTWGTGTALGRLVTVFCRPLTMNIKAAPITRPTTPSKPAARGVTGDGRKALKSVGARKPAGAKPASKAVGK